MNNFDDLQKRCKKYRTKQALKYIFAIFIIFAGVAFYLFFQTNTKQTDREPPQKKRVVVNHPVKKTKILKKKQVSAPVKEIKKDDTVARTYALQFLAASKNHKIWVDKKKKFLESLGFKNCKSIQSAVYIRLVCNESESLDTLKSYIELAKRNNLDYIIRRQSEKKIHTQEKVVSKQDKKTPNTTQHSNPILKVQNTNIQQLQKKFSQAPNYDIAMIIAHSYYKERDFNNAMIWAKKANRLDKSDAESWIIYARSFYALHQEDKARKLLHIYLQYENSEEVDKLLKEWEKKQ